MNKDSVSCLRENWFPIFIKEVNEAQEIRIISPFITDSMVIPLLDKIRGQHIHLLTRYNLADFFFGVSKLSALKKLIQKGASVRGIKGLHSKVYIFDSRLAIVSSANFTNGGMFNNYEFGLAVNNGVVVEECLNYFNDLYNLAGDDLTLDLVEDWGREVNEARIKNKNFKKKIGLPDYGSEADPRAKNKLPQIIVENEKKSYLSINKEKIGTRYFVKFFGTSSNRVAWSFNVKDEIQRAECHYACAWPKGKRPRQISDEDVVFMARLTNKPNGHAIFGRAWGIGYVKGRDDASEAEVKRCSWKKIWPHYIRVFDARFINGSMAQCVKLDDLMNKFGSDSFVSTHRNKQQGKGNTNPKKALMQQASVELTPEAAIWLDEQFASRIETIGPVEDVFIDSLPQTDNVNYRS